ncbi:MAG TPA: triose-phosphate isomerase [Casimicrobiaceae bacterium]
MRGRLVVGNWKLNGGLRQNDALLSALRSGWEAQGGHRMAVCVPFPYLWQAQAALTGSAIGWGAQDVSEHESGAYTGDVSATMVAEFGATIVLVGHSERRTLHGESDATVANKAVAALGGGLTPVVCVGETLAERDAGQTAAVVTRQLDAVRSRLADRIDAVMVAYEPVWAIGTGRNAAPAEAQEVHALLRKRLGTAGREMLLLYGGSVKAGNASALFAMPDIDGGLIGGASLKAEEFLAIAAA